MLAALQAQLPRESARGGSGRGHGMQHRPQSAAAAAADQAAVAAADGIRHLQAIRFQGAYEQEQSAHGILPM